MPVSIVAAEPSITLSLTNDQFLALLSENVELAEGLFRTLIESHHLTAGHTLIHGRLSGSVAAAATSAVGENSVNRLLLLQSSPLLTHATAAQLWRLSAIARPLAWPPSSPISRMPRIPVAGVFKVKMAVALVGAPKFTAGNG